MIADQEDNTGSQYIKYLNTIGYDYVELPVAEMMQLSSPRFDNILHELQENEIPCLCSNNLFPTFFRLTGDEKDTKEKIGQYLKVAFYRLQQLGVKKVVFGSGAAKKVPNGFPKGKAFEQLVDLSREMAFYANQADITIVIEPLCGRESNILNTLQETYTFCKDVNKPEVQMLIDYYHFRNEREPFTHLLKFDPAYLNHIHFSNPEGRKFPLQSDGEYKLYRRFFNYLSQIGYDGTISIEAYSSDPIPDLKNSLYFLRQLATLSKH